MKLPPGYKRFFCYMVGFTICETIAISIADDSHYWLAMFFWLAGVACYVVGAFPNPNQGDNR